MTEIHRGDIVHDELGENWRRRLPDLLEDGGFECVFALQVEIWSSEFEGAALSALSCHMPELDEVVALLVTTEPDVQGWYELANTVHVSMVELQDLVDVLESGFDSLPALVL